MKDVSEVWFKKLNFSVVRKRYIAETVATVLSYKQTYKPCHSPLTKTDFQLSSDY